MSWAGGSVSKPVHSLASLGRLLIKVLIRANCNGGFCAVNTCPLRTELGTPAFFIQGTPQPLTSEDFSSITDLGPELR